MEGNISGFKGFPNTQNIFKRSYNDQDDTPDLDFDYNDTDTFEHEIAELYSYSENPEFQMYLRAFEEQMAIYKLPSRWQQLSESEKTSLVMKLLDQLDVSHYDIRIRSVKCILYIAQGCWFEVLSDYEQQQVARKNVFLLYELGVFNAFMDLLHMEIEELPSTDENAKKIHNINIVDSYDLRIIINVLYTITEVMRNESENKSSEYAKHVESFYSDLLNPHGQDLIVVTLFKMVTKYCEGKAMHFPVKKVVLLLWKLVLITLGGMDKLKLLKEEQRVKYNLPPQKEDTLEVARTMRASSPPVNASDLLDMQNQECNARSSRGNLVKQTALYKQEALELDVASGEDQTDMIEYNLCVSKNSSLDSTEKEGSAPPKKLPWTPKVRQKDVDTFLDGVRMKFVGYTISGDRETLVGLPSPIHEGVKALKENIYISVSELQIQKEEEIYRNPFSIKEPELEMTPAEILYQAMLPRLPHFIIALLKVLLAAAPTSKTKAESINVTGDVTPEEMPKTLIEHMKLSLDINRHKEIIVKAVSATLLLLVKHFKINHVYQFEFVCQHLVFANCIPLILKFFNQNIILYIGTYNTIPILEFPACVIGEQPELTNEALDIGHSSVYSWRNIFSCINLLRLLNKLTKWKHSRIMMLVIFKSAPILKRALRIRHPIAQLYILKLLKMQMKYLGRQWRKSNMKTISAIYSKVRHRFNDDWVFGNDLDTRPWDFQSEETCLRTAIDRFNARRYTENTDLDYEPVDNCLSSVLGVEHDLSDTFKKNYELWLEKEVLNESIDWESLVFSPVTY